MGDYRWVLQRYSDSSQKEKILDLRKIVFKDEDPDKENVAFWNWEFEDNYAGEADIFLAVDQEKVVGHYAVCPSTVWVDGKEKRGSIVVDVMTHPDYRFQGMFTKIGRYSLAEAGKDGIDFSYGFPIRKEVLPGHLKVGWDIAFKLPVYVYPIEFSKIFAKFLKRKTISAVLGVVPQAVYNAFENIQGFLCKDYIIEEANGFTDSPELRQFIEATKNQHRVMQSRETSFLKWRYEDNCFRKYKVFFARDKEKHILGYIVLRKAAIYDLDCITIIDIQALHCNKDIVRVLLRQAHRYAKACHESLVGCMINNNKYKNQLLKSLYLKSPYIFKFIIHQNREIDYSEVIMKNENWFLTWADTDDL